MTPRQLINGSTWLALFAAGLLAGSRALAAGPVPPSDAEMLFIEEVLEQPVEMELKDMPLPEFAAMLKDKYRIPVVVDSRALEESEVAADAKLSCHLKGVALRSAITWALAANSMDWMVREEALVLTTRDVVDSTMTTMVHDVSDFIKPRGDKEEADAASRRLEQLAEVVESTVMPGTWKSGGGEASIRPLEVGAGRILVVFHNRRGQEAVAMILDDIAFCAEEPTPGSPKRPGGSAAKVTSLRRAIRSR